VSTVIVVPCFNEAARWNAAYWDAITAHPEIELIFVDDGSTDATPERIAATVASCGTQAIRLERNSGKAEAVRQGLAAALDLDSRPRTVGFLDADGAFPEFEVRRLVSLGSELLDSDRYDALWSARILMAGRDISRHASRHYIGRAISTLVAPLHRYDVYDTQSGFKLFQRSSALEQCLVTPFRTRWFPDIELLQRWSIGQGRQMRIWEEPVSGWHDVGGSKVNRSQYVQLLKDLRHLYGTRVARSGVGGASS
jgi:dolichyl-phosphate beta-glucosyltransferase